MSHILRVSREQIDRVARQIALAVILSLGLVQAVGADIWKSIPIPLSTSEHATVLAGGTVVKLLDEPGQAVKAAYAVSILLAIPRTVATVVRDYAHYQNFMPYVARSTMEPDRASNLRSYQYIDLPWPINDRWYMVIVEPLKETADGCLSYSWSYVPRSGNIVDTHGTWTLVPLSDGRTLACYFVSADLGIRLPVWLIDLVTQHAIPEVFSRISSRLRHKGLIGPVEDTEVPTDDSR